MIPYRTIAIPSEVAAQVRASQQAPRYGHPAHIEVAAGYGPCRHCLRTFHVGKERRTLFTYDPFDGIGEVPLPGPIFIHTDTCERYPEEGGYPTELRSHAAVLTAYTKGQEFVIRIHVDHSGHELAVEQLLRRTDVDYIEVRDRVAGCYDFRIERAAVQEGKATPTKALKC